MGRGEHPPNGRHEIFVSYYNHRLYVPVISFSYVNDLNGERKKEIKNIGALDSLVLLGWVLPLLDL